MILLIILCLFSFLSFQSYLAFNIKFSEHQLNHTSAENIESILSMSKHSIIYNSNSLHSKNEFIRLSKPLEFMVWSKERKAINKQLELVLQNEINTTPYDAYLWRKLSFVQANPSSAEQAWALLKAIRLGGWDSSERILLTRHCVVNFEKLELVIPNQCRALISRLLKSKSLHNSSQKMGVTHRYLKWMLEKNDITLSGGVDD